MYFILFFLHHYRFQHPQQWCPWWRWSNWGCRRGNRRYVCLYQDSCSFASAIGTPPILISSFHSSCPYFIAPSLFHSSCPNSIPPVPIPFLLSQFHFCFHPIPGTDRHNIVEIPNPNANYPLPWENSTLFNNVDALWTSWGEMNPTAEDIAVAFASSGYYKCYRRSSCTDSVESRNPPLQQLLDNAPASFEGALLRFQTAGMYHYICSRNNNFTNRSQKGQITVQASNK